MEIAGDAIIENYVGGLSALDDAIRTLAALNLSTKQVLADAQTGAHPVKIAPQFCEFLVRLLHLSIICFIV